MLEIAREYPFLVPFLLVLVPVALVILIGCWLLILSRRGNALSITLKGLGIELAMTTTLVTPVVTKEEV